MYVELAGRDKKAMDVLWCKRPELVRKEIWTHLLANNLLRSAMCATASDVSRLLRLPGDMSSERPVTPE